VRDELFTKVCRAAEEDLPKRAESQPQATKLLQNQLKALIREKDGLGILKMRVL
jgi:predicted metal-binding protein